MKCGKWLLCVAVLVWSGSTAQSKEPAAPPQAPVLVGQVLALGTPIATTIEVRRASKADAFWGHRTPVSDDPIRTLRSDAQGNYRIAGLAPGYYALRAYAPGNTVSRGFVNLPALTGEVALTLHVMAGDQVAEGIVTGIDGKPFVGWVALGRQLGGRCFFGASSASALIRTDTQGRFQATGLPKGTLTFGAMSDGFFMGSIDWNLPQPGVTRVQLGEFTDVEMRRFLVRVLNADDGKPIAGASVLVNAIRASQRATTNRDGWFLVKSLDRAIDFHVSAEGFCNRYVSLSEMLGSGGVVRLLPTRTIHGSVHADGPIANVPVYAYPPGGRGAEPVSTRTAADGTFTLRDVPSGRVHVVAFGDGWITREFAEGMRADIPHFEFETSSSPLPPLKLRVERTASVRVDIKRPSTQRLCRVRFQYVLADNDRPSRGTPLQSLVDARTAWIGADGRAVVDVIPGYALSLRASDHVNAHTEATVPALSAGATHTLARELAKPRVVSVRLLDKRTGDPIPGAVVIPYPKAWNSWPLGEFATDAQGLARMTPFPEGGYSLTIHAPGYRDSGNGAWSGMFDVHTDHAITIQLNRAKRIQGVVRGPEALVERVVKVRVQAHNKKFPSGTHIGMNHEIFARFGTPFAGDFEDASYRLRVERLHDGYFWRAEANTTNDATPVSLVLHRAERAPPTQVVEIVGPDGVRVHVAQVHVHKGRARLGSLPLTQFPALHGTFAWGAGAKWQADADDELWLHVTGARRNGQALAATIAGPFKRNEPPTTITLAPGTTLSGLVLDAEGQRVPNIHVEALSDGHIYPQPVAADTSDNHGAFRIEGLDTDTYWIRVRHGSKEYAHLPNQRIDVRTTQQVTLQMRPAKSVTITVTDAEGAPVREARVKVSVGRWRLPQAWDRHRTGDDGKLVISGLDPERAYELSVEGDRDQVPALGKFGNAAWLPSDTVVVLDTVRSVVATVVNAAGEPQAMATVILTQHPRPNYTKRQERTSNAQGQVVFRDVSRGPATVVAKGADGSHSFAKVEIKDEPVEVRLVQ